LNVKITHTVYHWLLKVSKSQKKKKKKKKKRNKTRQNKKRMERRRRSRRRRSRRRRRRRRRRQRRFKIYPLYQYIHTKLFGSATANRRGVALNQLKSLAVCGKSGIVIFVGMQSAVGSNELGFAPVQERLREVAAAGNPRSQGENLGLSKLRQGGKDEKRRLFARGGTWSALCLS
jgi:Flp pilus assembly protein TadB